MTLVERITDVKKRNGISNADLSAECGLCKAAIDKQMQGLANVNINVVIALAKLAPAEDMRWVLTGEKSMSSSKRISKIEEDIKKIQETLSAVTKM